MKSQNMVQKTVDVLNYLSDNPQGAALSNIARDLQYPKTTVHDIIKTLMENDFVQFSKPPQKKYCIGAQVYTIGISYLESSSLFLTAKPYLILLADKYEKTTFLAKRHNDRVICVYKYASLHANAPTGNIGDQKRLHSTAIGKCYLAFDKEAFSLIDTIDLPAFTPHTITDRDYLRKHIEELRSLGYSWEKRESHIKMACLAAPIFMQSKMVGTISMTGWYREDEDFITQGNEIAQLTKLISVQLDQELKL
jgi:DNA-binding IclR family transcriptional regulator